MLRFLLILFFLSWNTQTLFGQADEPIDSVYLKTFSGFLRNAQKIQETVWPGMKLGPACIFRLNGPAFLINHPQPPSGAKLVGDSIYVFNQTDYALMGTSQTEINHHLTAHNNYGQAHFVSENQFYSELFHELHHVYQRNHVKNLKFDNPAELLTYPEDYRNDALKQYENELLLEMLSGPAAEFEENLNKFFSCRALRREIIGEKYINYEKQVESAEGPATYCEYKYMIEFGSTVKEQEYINKRFFYSLIEPAYGRDGLRNRHLLTGMVQCVLLSRSFAKWQPEYYNSGLALNDYFFSKFKARKVQLPKLTAYEAKAKHFTAIEKEKHKQNLTSFNNQNGLKITLVFDTFPKFRGFDPMHAEAVNDSLILHSTLLKLGKGSNHFNLAYQRALTQIQGEVWFVKSVSFFVPEGTVQLKKDVFVYKDQNVDINWRYGKHEKKGNEYIIRLE